MIRLTKPIRFILTILAFMALGACLWFLRSWNTTIGDGLFCCKQVVGEDLFTITLSRSTLSLLLYRGMFQTLYPLLNWWVEDIIALASCAAGLVFFWGLYRLSVVSAKDLFERIAFLLFPSTTLLFQIFCGHIEFYSWTCALLMVSAYLSWRTIHDGWSPVWPSLIMVLAAGFHSSGVFYFPALLLIPVLARRKDKEPIRINKQEWKEIVFIFIFFMIIILLHRKIMLYRILFLLALPIYFRYLPQRWKEFMRPWWPICLPWLALFTLRAFFGLRAEPLLEHVAPFKEPYDHGAFLYMFFSWGHLFDKSMFHLFLAPFGLISMIFFSVFFPKTIFRTRWLVFLFNFCIWTMIWTIIFYNQLRDLDWYLSSVIAVPPRDWDLFASMAIPLNLFAVYAMARCIRPMLFRILIPFALATHLVLTVPIVIDTSGILSVRGYITLECETEPVPANVHFRQLKLGQTPLKQANLRAGWGELILIPTDPYYNSWSVANDFKAGEYYQFSPTLEEKKLPQLNQSN